MRCSFLLLLLCSFMNISFGQEPENFKSIKVNYTTAAFNIDGVLDESQWGHIEPATDFWQYFPTDSLLAKSQTEVSLATDGKNLYVGIKCYGAGNNWIVNSLKRDYRAGGNDNITLVFDSFDDNTNAFFFGINPQGVIREGVVTNGGNGFRDFSESWDNKWKGEAKIFDGYYTAEMEIPFSTLRFNANNTKWGLLIYRFDTQANETSVWNRVPRNQTLFNLAYTGDMTWEHSLAQSNSRVSIIPFVTGGTQKDYEQNLDRQNNSAIGGDVKIGVTSGLNLDLTVNPDFSQVEVDRQITNLSRFEIFFPERRQFFIENADLFGSFGFSTINPFFSRRIGIAKDQLSGNTVQNRILGGARLSGKLDKNTRIGILNMQTERNDAMGIPGINNSVAVLQRKIWDRSNVGFIFINKQATGDALHEYGLPGFNRLAGIDFNYATSDNTWTGKTFLHSAFSPSTSAQLAHGTELNYNKRTFGIEWQHEYVPDDYNAELGFVRRTNYFRINPQAELKFYPQNNFINEFSFGAETEIFWRPGFGKTDHTYSLGINGQLSNSSRFFLSVNHDYIYLFDDFDPTGTSATPLKGGTSYQYFNFTGFIRSDSRKMITLTFRPYFGQYFNGWRTGISGDVSVRYQPRGSVNLSYAWNIFNMPHLDKVARTFLFGPRIDYTFSRSFFATAFIQYNSQSKNTNINTRLQWRFAPVSDFFLVITDNYFSGNLDEPSDRFSFNLRNRAIVAKLSYWINV